LNLHRPGFLFRGSVYPRRHRLQPASTAWPSQFPHLPVARPGLLIAGFACLGTLAYTPTRTFSMQPHRPRRPILMPHGSLRSCRGRRSLGQRGGRCSLGQHGDSLIPLLYLVRGMKLLGPLLRSIRCIERKIIYKNNYTNRSEIARRIH
jgi:hypothetical protein